MKRTTAFALLVIMIFTLCACEKKAEASWQEQYDLGVKYLNEGNYEEAVIAFDAAIEIDPKRPEAYIGLADAYIALGDTEKARSVLEQGYNATGDEALKKHLEDEDSRTWAMSGFVTPQELTLGGVPYYEVDINSIPKIYPSPSGYTTEVIAGSYFDLESGISCTSTENIDTDEKGDPSKVGIFSYIHSPEFKTSYQPEFRELKTGMSPENALACLGFTPEGIEYILNSEHEGGIFTSKALEGKDAISELKDHGLPLVRWDYRDLDNSGDTDDLDVSLSWSASDVMEEVALYLYFVNGILNSVQLGGGY